MDKTTRGSLLGLTELQSENEEANRNYSGLLKLVHQWLLEDHMTLRKSTSRSFIEEVKEANDIVEVVSEHLNLNNNKALCPFHKEKTPSFSVNPKGQYFKCFGCHVGGDVIKFVQAQEGKSFPKALESLAKRAGIPIPGSLEDEPMEADRCREDVLIAAARFYHRSLDERTINYLKGKRCLNDETISQMQIGFGRDGLFEYLYDHCWFSVSECLQAGVIRLTGSNYKEFFRECITLPSFKNGRIVDMVGRRIEQ